MEAYIRVDIILHIRTSYSDLLQYEFIVIGRICGENINITAKNAKNTPKKLVRL